MWEDRFKWVAAFLAAMVMVAAVLVVQSTSGLRDDLIRNREAVDCILLQFAEHRADNVEAHRAIERSLEIEPTLDRPPPIPQTLVGACDPFLPEETAGHG